MNKSSYSLKQALLLVRKCNFKNRSELSRRNNIAYRVLKDHKKLDEVFPKIPKKERYLALASKYDSLSEFLNTSAYAYLSKHYRKELHKILPPKRIRVDPNKVRNQNRKKALKFKTRTKLFAVDPKLYNWFHHHDKKWMHNNLPKENYSPAKKYKELASYCKTRMEFAQKHPTPYSYLRKFYKDWLDHLFLCGPQIRSPDGLEDKLARKLRSLSPTEKKIILKLHPNWFRHEK